MKNVMFHSASSADLGLDALVEVVQTFMDDDHSAQYKLTIGSDSEVKTDQHGAKNLHVITAVVIHRKGYGGRYFWTKEEIKNVKTLRDKIYHEVLRSIETAKDLVPELRSKINGHNTYDLEVHVDVGEGGETKAMINEVVGMVTGNGFVAKTKPDSYAASSVADRHV